MSLQLGIFARPPWPGQTKTRLIPALGPEGACALHEAFLDDVGATALRLRDRHRDVQLVIYSAEPDPGDALSQRAQRWGALLVAQQGDDLGARMAHALATGIAQQGAALLLGSDAPSLPLSILLAAREALGEPVGAAHVERQPPSGAPSCVGPVADGGYILVGARGAPPSFEGVRMGTRHALADTLRANPSRHVARLAPWYDVDTPEDLRLLALHLALDPRAAPHSAALLAGLPGGLTCLARALPSLASRPGFVSNLGVRPETC